MKKKIFIILLCIITICMVAYRAEIKAEKQQKLNKQIEKEVKKPKPKQKIEPKNSWKPLGKKRITCYCPHCNDPHGYESSSGKTLRYGYAACNFLPIGAKINIEGETFIVMDRCGPNDVIDIFIDTDSCQCNINEYRSVSIFSGDELE